MLPGTRPWKEVVAATTAGVKGGLRGHEMGHERPRCPLVFRELIHFQTNFSAVGNCWVVCNSIPGVYP